MVERYCVRITEENEKLLSEFLNKGCKTTQYNVDCLGHFKFVNYPNLRTHKGFKLLSHLSDEVHYTYKEVSLEEFFKNAKYSLNKNYEIW